MNLNIIKKHKITAIVCAGLLGVLIIGLIARGQPTKRVVAADYRVTAQGRLDSAEEARTLAAERDGIISKVFVRPGQKVEAGQLLVQINCADVESDLAAAKATLQEAQAKSDLVKEGPRLEEIAAAEARARAEGIKAQDAKDLFDRTNRLSSSGFATDRSIKNAKNAMEIANADFQSASNYAQQMKRGSRPAEISAAIAKTLATRAQVDSAEATLRKCSLRSPISGEVLRLFKREGEFSGANYGASIVSVGDLSHIIVRAEVDERQARSVTLGEAAEVWVNGETQRYKGKVIELSMQMGRKSARSLDPSDRFDRDVREVIIELDDPGVPTLIGLRVNVGIGRMHK